MQGTFQITWPDELGPHWMNKDNLLLCLNAYCKNVKFGVKDVSLESFNIAEKFKPIYDLGFEEVSWTSERNGRFCVSAQAKEDYKHGEGKTLDEAIKNLVKKLKR